MKAKASKGSKQVALLLTPAQLRVVLTLIESAVTNGFPYRSGIYAADSMTDHERTRALVGCWRKASFVHMRHTAKQAGRRRRVRT